MFARAFAVRPPGRAGHVRTELREALELIEASKPPVRLVLVMLTGPGHVTDSGILYVGRVLERHEVTLADEEGPVPGAMRHLTPEENDVWNEYLSAPGGAS